MRAFPAWHENPECVCNPASGSSLFEDARGLLFGFRRDEEGVFLSKGATLCFSNRRDLYILLCNVPCTSAVAPKSSRDGVYKTYTCTLGSIGAQIDSLK